jgi:group I intron endonuclease
MRVSIRKELANLEGSCIYLFFSSLNPKICYVGSTINPVLRFSQHASSHNNTNRVKHPKFYNYLNKYGLETKNFLILAQVNKAELKDLEQRWLNDLFTQYGSYILNISTSVYSITTGPLSAEHKFKLSKSKKGKTLSAEHK